MFSEGDLRLNKPFIILGIIVAVVGIGGYIDSTSTHIILTGTHHTSPLAGLGITILGALLAVGGVLMGKSGVSAASEFKCATCGAVFSSQKALEQHSSAKHGTKP